MLTHWSQILISPSSRLHWLPTKESNCSTFRSLETARLTMLPKHNNGGWCRRGAVSCLTVENSQVVSPSLSLVVPLFFIVLFFHLLINPLQTTANTDAEHWCNFFQLLSALLLGSYHCCWLHEKVNAESSQLMPRWEFVCHHWCDLQVKLGTQSSHILMQLCHRQ